MQPGRNERPPTRRSQYLIGGRSAGVRRWLGVAVHSTELELCAGLPLVHQRGGDLDASHRDQCGGELKLVLPDGKRQAVVGQLLTYVAPAAFEGFKYTGFADRATWRGVEDPSLLSAFTRSVSVLFMPGSSRR